MAVNKNATDRLSDLMPAHFAAKYNQNWKALLSAIGEQDQATMDLISEVRKQFFIKTAYRPYIDVLSANEGISRPRLVGMDDPSFRKYIPVLSYQPKQVKLIIDQLLDIFFFKESTTAFITSQNFSPFTLNDGDALSYIVDEQNQENIVFRAADFTDITSATVDEVVATFNRQAKYSYATHYHDSITKHDYIRIFTNTIGSTGSLRLIGGAATVAFRLNGFIDLAGQGSNTQWSITKVGQKTTMQHVGGTSPGINQLDIGDILISSIPGNVGSFVITNVDISNDQIQFVNLFATPGNFTQTSALETKFILPTKFVAFTNNQRAMSWETAESQFTVEMPTTPPVVKRKLAGSYHMNGSLSLMTNRNSDTSLTLLDATKFPNSGTFAIQPVMETQTDVMSTFQNGRLIGDYQRYTYTSRTAFTTTGNLTIGLNIISGLVSLAGIVVGQTVFTDGIRGDATVVSIDIINSLITVSAPSTVAATGQTINFGGNTLTGISPALPALATLITSGLANSGSTIILLDAVSAYITRIFGAYMWDPKAPFVLSKNTTSITNPIIAGKIIKLLDIGPNTIPNQEGFVMFDYGQNTQEGPVRYLYKPSSTTIALDPSYVFLQPHNAGSAITALSHKGPHLVSTTGIDFPAYITDPSEARVILENLILSVKSAGIFVDFLVRFPVQLYSTINVYNNPNFVAD